VQPTVKSKAVSNTTVLNKRLDICILPIESAARDTDAAINSALIKGHGEYLQPSCQWHRHHRPSIK